MLTIVVGWIATHQSIRLGSETILGTNVVSGIASLCGVILNAASIRLRVISGSGKFDKIPFLLALSGAVGALIPILSLNWLNDKQVTFKV